MRQYSTVIAFVGFLLLCNPLLAQLRGKVVAIADGDTFTLLISGNKQVKIRLHGIDCPEKKQAYGMVARQCLSDSIFGKTIEVKVFNKDRYGRSIGMVYTPKGTNMNESLLKAGLAWHFKKYDKNPNWAVLEDKARKAKRGLWADAHAIAPWEWRK
ncbi:MAG TPA: thermonuclease family protein [Phnomibacter sp.]|nr:thermonuclease family protein [Phnomibacter sp.]